MPLYEYTCKDCGERFEVLQRVGEGAESVLCPECGGHEVAKELSTFAASVSGSGGFTSSAPVGCGSGACGTGFT